MPQDMRCDNVRPIRQILPRGADQRRAQHLITNPGRGAVGVAAFRRKQRHPGPGVIVTELRPHVLDEPPQRRTSVVDQWHHALARPRVPGILAMTHVHPCRSGPAAT